MNHYSALLGAESRGPARRTPFTSNRKVSQTLVYKVLHAGTVMALMGLLISSMCLHHSLTAGAEPVQGRCISTIQ